MAQIPRTSWELRGSELEQRRRHHADLATLAYLLAGPERRVVIYTIDDEAYLPVELGAALEQESHWEFRFKGDPGNHDLDGYDYVEPDTTAEDIARYEDRRTVLDWIEKHRNEPAYSHPDVQKGYFWRGRDDKELAFSDRRRIDSAPKPRPVEHLFEE